MCGCGCVCMSVFSKFTSGNDMPLSQLTQLHGGGSCEIIRHSARPAREPPGSCSWKSMSELSCGYRTWTDPTTSAYDAHYCRETHLKQLFSIYFSRRDCFLSRRLITLDYFNNALFWYINSGWHLCQNSAPWHLVWVLHCVSRVSAGWSCPCSQRSWSAALIQLYQSSPSIRWEGCLSIGLE